MGGLSVGRLRKGSRSRLNPTSNVYPTGIEFSDQEFAAVNRKRSTFHGDWNHIIAASARNNRQLVLTGRHRPHARIGCVASQAKATQFCPYTHSPSAGPGVGL